MSADQQSVRHTAPDCAPAEPSAGGDFVSTTPTGSVLPALLGRLAATMAACVAGIQDDRDPETLHAYRVALRRTRSLVRAFRKLFDPAWYARARGDLRWLAAGTGRLRDLDVLDDEIVRGNLVATVVDSECQAAVRKILQGQRQRELDRIRRQFGTARHARILRDWESLQGCLRGNEPAVHAPVGERAAAAITRRYRRVREDIEALSEDAPYTALHGLRKNCKRLRYLVDAFATLYPERTLKPINKDLKRVQDILGELCDRHAQTEMIGTWLGGPAARGAAGAGLEVLLAARSAPPGRAEKRHLDRALARLACDKSQVRYARLGRNAAP